jgi:uncharacterized protein YybS (DUF2232 family)
MKPGETSFSLWHAPDSWVFGLIASLALLLLQNDTLQLIGLNFAILFGTLYLVQGIALADFFLRKIKAHGIVRTIFLSLMLVLLPGIAALIALGVLDIWTDLRKVRKPIETT